MGMGDKTVIILHGGDVDKVYSALKELRTEWIDE
jgi:hypothetical protein